VAIIKQGSTLKSIKSKGKIHMAMLLDHTRFAIPAECFIDNEEIAW
jgi:hypothetical protein